MGARFRYALEPIALRRRWALDALLRDLSDCNVELARRRTECDAVLAQADLAAQEWRAIGAGAAVGVERFALLARYLAERRRVAQTMEGAIAQLRRQRDEVIDHIAAARRALDAVEEHRGEMRAEFIKTRLSGEFKDADDRWNVLHIVRATDDD